MNAKQEEQFAALVEKVKLWKPKDEKEKNALYVLGGGRRACIIVDELRSWARAGNPAEADEHGTVKLIIEGLTLELAHLYTKFRLHLAYLPPVRSVLLLESLLKPRPQDLVDKLYIRSYGGVGQWILNIYRQVCGLPIVQAPREAFIQGPPVVHDLAISGDDFEILSHCHMVIAVSNICLRGLGRLVLPLDAKVVSADQNPLPPTESSSTSSVEMQNPLSSTESSSASSAQMQNPLPPTKSSSSSSAKMQNPLSSTESISGSLAQPTSPSSDESSGYV